jgi:coenzyme F420 biosynthesis associated uncharacterized protein
VIDWFVAERIARLIAGSGDPSVPTTDLRELARESEARVVAYTGLVPATVLPEPEGIGRREWVASNIGSMRRLIDPVLERARVGVGPLRPAVQIGIGLTMSVEVGVLVGYMAQRVLGQYELMLLSEPTDAQPETSEGVAPRIVATPTPPPRLLFVMPNLGHAVRAFGADEREFMTWVALHEVTHAVQFGAVPWLRGYLGGLVRELLASAESRLDRPGRVRLPRRDELAAAARSLHHGDLISVVASPSERETLDRVQAVMAVIEGHAEHVMDVVAGDLLPSLPRMRASLEERRRSQKRLSRLLGRLLGIEMKLRQYERGRAFCDAIVASEGQTALARLFSAPEALPTLAEVQNPPAWLARTGGGEAADRVA